MLALNGMTWDDIRWLQPGSIILVPPKAGTYTPTSAAPTDTATATATSAQSATESSKTPTALPATARPTPAATRVLRINGPQAVSAAPAPLVDAGSDESAASYTQLLLLGAAILIQMGVIGGAALELLRRSR